LQRQKTDLENRSRQLTHEMTESTKRVEKLREHIRVYETSLDEQRRIRDDLKLEVGSSKGMYINSRIHDSSKKMILES